MSAVQIKTSKKPWSPEEDTLLMELIELHGIVGNWPKIALEMEFRSGKQCRERYINQLDPLIKKSMWTVEEDSTIKRIHFEIGKKWCRYMDQLPGRSDNAIKNRYHVISRDNYAEHNLHHAASLAIVVTEPESGIFVEETAAIRLERFRSARNLLDAKIEALERERQMLDHQATEDEEALMHARSPDCLFKTLQDGFNTGEMSGTTTDESAACERQQQQQQQPEPCHTHKSAAASVSTVQSSLSESSGFAGHVSKNPDFASLDFGAQDFSTVMDEFHFDFEDLCYEYSHGSTGKVHAMA